MRPPDNHPSLKRIIGQYGLRARKSLGQHYLLDTSLCEKIAQAAGPMGDADVLEVGPGPGGARRGVQATASSVRQRTGTRPGRKEPNIP